MAAERTKSSVTGLIAEIKAEIELEDPAGPWHLSPDLVTRVLAFLESQLEADAPPIPFDDIIAAYHNYLPTLAKVSKLTDQRRRQLARRWAEDKTRQSVVWWANYFVRASRSDFLMGREQRGRNWRADFDFFLQPKSMTKIIEGAYGIAEARPISDVFDSIRNETANRVARSVGITR
jgi:hypothetical protein